MHAYTDRKGKSYPTLFLQLVSKEIRIFLKFRPAEEIKVWKTGLKNISEN
jgi:hypothetical protein